MNENCKYSNWNLFSASPIWKIPLGKQPLLNKQTLRITAIPASVQSILDPFSE